MSCVYRATCHVMAVPALCALLATCLPRAADAGVPECEFQLGTDCNSNGIDDGCDLTGGTSSDCNENFVPDECELMFTFVDDAGSSGTFILNPTVTDQNENPGLGRYGHGVISEFDYLGGTVTELITFAVVSESFWALDFNNGESGSDLNLFFEGTALVDALSAVASDYAWNGGSIFNEAFGKRTLVSLVVANLALSECGCFGVPVCDSTSACPAADVDCDGVVTGLDVAIITSSINFGGNVCQAINSRSDVDQSGSVNGLDVAIATNSACFGL